MEENVCEVPERVTYKEGNEGKGWGAEAGGCSRAEAVYSLHTMTNLYPDELECDKNAGPGRAAEREVKTTDRTELLELTCFPRYQMHTQNTERHNYKQTHEKLRTRDPSLGYDLTSFDITSLAGGWAESS